MSVVSLREGTRDSLNGLVAGLTAPTADPSEAVAAAARTCAVSAVVVSHRSRLLLLLLLYGVAHSTHARMSRSGSRAHGRTPGNPIVAIIYFSASLLQLVLLLHQSVVPQRVLHGV